MYSLQLGSDDLTNESVENADSEFWSLRQDEDLANETVKKMRL